MQTNDTAYFIKDWNGDVVNWTEALINYNQSYNSGSLVKGKEGFYVSHEAHKIDKVKKVLEENNFNVAHLYFNIITSASTFGKHNDTMDVWFWQCEGVTKWIINNKESIILNPGDLIYVPAKVDHEVVPLSPRVGISMSREKLL